MLFNIEINYCVTKFWIKFFSKSYLILGSMFQDPFSHVEVKAYVINYLASEII
jgi:hypothetical protein